MGSSVAFQGRLQAMPTTMQAVVKAKAAHGIECAKCRSPRPAPARFSSGAGSQRLRNRSPHLQLGPWAKGRIHPPLIPGHEFSGAVAGVGRGVSTVKEGDLVSAEMHVACGKCLQCRTGQAHICQHVRILGVDADGAFAGYAIIPETNIWKLSPSIPARLRLAAGPSRQRGPHRAGRSHRRHHRRRHRLRSHRPVLDRRRQGLRSLQSLRHRSQRAPPASGLRDGRGSRPSTPQPKTWRRRSLKPRVAPA